MARKAAVQAKAHRGPTPKPSGMPQSPNLAEVEANVDDDDGGDQLESESDTGIAEGVSDNIGEQSVEINVENLIAELEAESHRGRKPEVHCARQKLEDYLERKRTARDLEDFEDW